MFHNYINFIVIKITTIFEILNTNAFDCHFIFFISPFQRHCFRNFNSDFEIKLVKLTGPGVKPLQVLINFTHQKLSYLTMERTIDFLSTVISIKFFLSELLCHDSCWFFCLYRNVFLEYFAKERNFCGICVEFSFANLLQI